MNNNLYIDDLNVLGRFGCRVTRGGYNDLLAFPAMKAPERNDWPEEDGIEVDLSDPKLQPREIAISFLSDSNSQASDLIAYLSDKGLHTFRVPALGREWQLRLADHPGNRVYPSATSFTLKFVEDLPVRPTAGVCDPDVWLPESRYKLDGKPIGRYGVYVYESRNALLRNPAAKVNLQRKIASIDGQIYDAEHLVFQPKEVTFKCFLKTIRKDAFWQCWDSFFADLIAPGERRLFVEEIGKSYPCYYKKMSNCKLLTLGEPMVMQFDLTLVFTSFRLFETDYFLATEDDMFIVTEEMESLYTQDKLTESAKVLFEQLQKLKDEGEDVAGMIDDLNEEMKEAFTGTNTNAIADTILQGFAEGKRSAKDFTDDFQKMLNDAVLQGVKMKALEEPLRKWYESFAAASQNGLTAESIASLKAQYDKIIEDAAKQLEQMEQVTGTTIGDVIDRTSTAKGIASMSQDSADELNGNFYALLIYADRTNQGVTNIQGQLVEGLSLLQRIASNTDRLEAIEKDIRQTRSSLQNIENRGLILRKQ